MLYQVSNSGLMVLCRVSRYSYAIVGINLTEMAYSLLKSGDLKPHFYNTVTGNPEMHHFHRLYCEYKSRGGFVLDLY